MSDVVKYIKAVSPGLTIIQDVKFEEGFGLNIALRSGEVVDLLSRFTQKQIQQSLMLSVALRSGNVVGCSKDDYDVFLNREEEVEPPVVARVIRPGEDDNPFIGELQKVEEQQEKLQELDPKKRMIVKKVERVTFQKKE